MKFKSIDFKKWSVRMPIIFAAYHLLLCAVSSKLPPGPRGVPSLVFIAGELPVMPPVVLIMPRVANFIQSATGSYPRGIAEGLLFVGVPLVCWIVYGIVIGVILDRWIAARKS